MPIRSAGRRRRGSTTPLVLHLHGGAFTSGGVEAGECLSTRLADAGAVVTLGYPLAPEHPFPAAVEAGYAALAWAYAARGRLAGARAPLFVAGEEAEGNIAAAAAMMARDRAAPELAGMVLVAPMLDRAAQLQATVTLIRALGGRWDGCRCAAMRRPRLN